MSKKGFFGEINIQQVPKPNKVKYYVRLADETSIPEYTVCGYEFTLDLRKDSIGTTEGNDKALNFRRVFLPEEGHYWVSRDFSGQELRILANLSGEKAWVNAFLHDEDIHKATAEAVWGKENYSSDKRAQAKTLNFGLMYGMTPVGVSRTLGITVDEAEALTKMFFKNLPAIKQTLDSFLKEATNTGEIKSFYGRKRRMRSYITPYGNLMGRGRTIGYNFPIQSLGADITKLAILKIYNNILLKPEYKGKVYFMNTIHDEINTSVAYDIAPQVIYELGEMMTHKLPGGAVPIITGLEIGHSMGLIWPFNQDLETLELTPIMKELTIKEKEEQKLL